MASKEEIRTYIIELEKRLRIEMPKVRDQIKVYEDKLANGQLTQSPTAAPQFNG